jgi:hypothetical protein
MFALPPRVDSGLRMALQALAVAQDGIARRDQVIALGLSRRVVDGMVEADRWRRYGSVVIALHNGPPTGRQQWWIALLNAGGLAALAARTAASELGLAGWDPPSVEILTTRGSSYPRGLPFEVKVHESRRFAVSDIHPGRSIPTVRIERALVDAAAWSRSPKAACGVLCAGVQQRLTVASRLRAELAVAGSIRHRQLLGSVLIDIEGGAQAMSEVGFLSFCRRHGLPAPLLQRVRLDRFGKRRYLDATFRKPGGRLLRVEIDGALHLVVRTYWDDMSRGNELVIGEEQVLRFPSYAIHADDKIAVDQLRRALNLSGAAHAIAG